MPIGAAVGDALGRTGGQVLCFLPGAGEIRAAITEIVREHRGSVEVVPLHGSLTAQEQDAALAPAPARRVVVATNIAETSLTVPDVTAVIDSGLHKVARYDPTRGIDSLQVERIPADAADQRAGRAGRVAPGIVIRLWDERDRLRPHREPDIHRVDLAATALDVIAWGGDPRTLEWFERPTDAALDAALSLLERLALVAAGRLTATGARVARLPLHPRLATLIVAADGAANVARACALLAERQFRPPHAATTTSDVLSALDRWSDMPAHVHQTAAQIAALIGRKADLDERAFRRVFLAGYADRVARRREPGGKSFLLSSGTGADLGRESGVRDAEFVVAVDVTETALPGGPRFSPHSSDRREGSIIRMASAVDREWLTPTAVDTRHWFDSASGRVRAARVDRYDALVLAEHPVAIDPARAAPLLAAAWLERGPREADAQLLRRLAFAGIAVDLGDLVRAAALSAPSLDGIDLRAALEARVVRDLDRLAPSSLAVPSGRAHRLEYGDDGSVTAAVKLQELFGLAETPRVGPRRVPVRLALLSPSGRPVQVTQDLRSFWQNTYPEVRKELRGRYPKHPWPEDPWTATPTSRTRRRSG
jgi:ATP-dependent helicase HrpB